jgi:hypothetical protein
MKKERRNKEEKKRRRYASQPCKELITHCSVTQFIA